MTGNEIAAVVVAFSGVLTAIFVGARNLRSDKFKHDVEASAALLAGYTSMVNTLQAQIASIEERHAREREEWQTRERRMREEHAEEIKELHERIDELGSQIYALKHRPPETRSREEDRP